MAVLCSFWTLKGENQFFVFSSFLRPLSFLGSWTPPSAKCISPVLASVLTSLLWLCPSHLRRIRTHDYAKSTWMIQDNFFISRSFTSYICKVSLQCKVTYLQDSGVRTWIYLKEPLFSFYRAPNQEWLWLQIISYLIQYDYLEMLTGSVLIAGFQKGITGRDNSIIESFAIFALSDNVISDASS